MKILILLISICTFGSVWSKAVDCDAQIQQYRACTDKIRTDREHERKHKMETLKPKTDKCYTSNGCKSPSEEVDPALTAKIQKREQCHKDINLVLKTKIRDCVRETSPKFEFPTESKDQGTHEGGFKKFKGGKRDLEKQCGGSADKAKLVEACIKTARDSDKLTEAQQKQRFDQNCAARQKCDTALGACRAPFDTLKKAVCMCHQSMRTDVNIQAARKSSKSCDGDQGTNTGKGKHANEPKKETHSCDGSQQKDWCNNGGYDAWKKSQTEKQAEKHTEKQHHNAKKPFF